MRGSRSCFKGLLWCIKCSFRSRQQGSGGQCIDCSKNGREVDAGSGDGKEESDRNETSSNVQ